MVTDLILPKRGIIVPKPKSYLKLDMAFGVGVGTSLYDKSRYRSHGAITGASWADGAHGRCLDFDPTLPSYVEIPAAYDQLNFTSEDFSIIARLKVDNFAADCSIFCRGLAGTDGYRFLVIINGRIYFSTHNAAGSQITYSPLGDIVINTWYTIGLSRNGEDVTLYKNGVDVNELAGVHLNPLTCTKLAIIGVYNDLITQPLDGKIEFLRVFGGIALPASAHLAYHNALK